MATEGILIKDLSAKTTIADDDLVVIGEGNDAKKMTVAKFKELIGIDALNTKTANLSGMSITEIVSLFGTYGGAGIGYKSWNDAYATPDGNYSFIFYTKDVAIAITFGGNIYRATLENPTWEAAG